MQSCSYKITHKKQPADLLFSEFMPSIPLTHPLYVFSNLSLLLLKNITIKPVNKSV